MCINEFHSMNLTSFSLISAMFNVTCLEIYEKLKDCCFNLFNKCYTSQNNKWKNWEGLATYRSKMIKDFVSKPVQIYWHVKLRLVPHLVSVRGSACSYFFLQPVMDVASVNICLWCFNLIEFNFLFCKSWFFLCFSLILHI